jgi:hypothetical protein
MDNRFSYWKWNGQPEEGERQRPRFIRLDK